MNPTNPFVYGLANTLINRQHAIVTVHKILALAVFISCRGHHRHRPHYHLEGADHTHPRVVDQGTYRRQTWY